ncbi:MAG: vitamin K epoxide reductase family protein [Candidatus Sulfotelmatobacter sp.]
MSAAGNLPDDSGTVSERRNRIVFLVIAVLSAAGMAVSGLSLQRHYAKSATSFCELGEKFDCDIVNRSEYSSLMGIPVAGIGIAGYGVLLALSARCRSRGESPMWLFATAAAGLVFALYLTYVEAYVLGTWCVLCLGSLGLIVIITGLAGVAQVQSRNSS